MTLQPNITKILTEAYEARSLRNPGYSLRAFARDLGISSPSLSLILKGKQGLSGKAAKRIAERLGLSSSEKEFFCDLVLSTHSRSQRARGLAQIRLRKHDHTGSSLDLEMFKVISDWYHFAILELTGIAGFKNSGSWIARSLGITKKQAELAVSRLLQLELLEEIEGTLRRTSDFVATPSGIPSEALKKYNSQLLQKAEAAIFTQSTEERDFSGVLFALSLEDMAWAKEEIKNFRRKLMAKMEANPKRDRVYCFSTSLFSLQSSQDVRSTQSVPKPTLKRENENENDE